MHQGGDGSCPRGNAGWQTAGQVAGAAVGCEDWGVVVLVVAFRGQQRELYRGRGRGSFIAELFLQFLLFQLQFVDLVGQAVIFLQITKQTIKYSNCNK